MEGQIVRQAEERVEELIRGQDEAYETLDWSWT